MNGVDVTVQVTPIANVTIPVLRGPTGLTGVGVIVSVTAPPDPVIGTIWVQPT